MYILKKEKITGMVRVKKEENEVRKVERKQLVDILEKEGEKEKEAIKRYDYKVLRDGIMGIEALILGKEHLQVVYTQENMWRKEGEAIIENNNRLIRILRKVYDNPPIQRKKRGTLQE